MQQVLNSQERNQAFLKFLTFFVITVILVVAAIFFNYKLPSRENKMLQDEVAVQRVHELDQQRFAGKLDEAIVLLDSLDKKGTNIQQVDIQLASKISDLTTLAQNDNSPYGRITKFIAYRLTDLKENKKKLLEASGNDSKISSIENEWAKCRAEVDRLNGLVLEYKKQQGL